MDRKKVLKDSIAKLIELGVSDEEIVANLGSVGIEKDDAAEALAEAKGELLREPARKNETGQQGGREAEGKYADSEASAEEIAEGLTTPQQGSEEDISAEILEEAQQKAPASPRQPKKDYSIPPRSAQDNISELWEKGILSTVDSKLDEMRAIRKELDSVLDSKISEKVKKESIKVETVLESQSALFSGRMDAHLQAKASEIRKVLEARASHLEDLHEKVQESLRKIQGEKKFTSELLNSVNEKLSSLETAKSQVISEANSSIITIESKFAEMADANESSRKDAEEKLTAALNLSAKICQDMTDDAAQKIERLELEKNEELDKKIASKLKDIEEMSSAVDIEKITQTISQIDGLETQLKGKLRSLDEEIANASEKVDSRIEAKFNELSKAASKKAAEQLENLRKEYAAGVDELFSENLEAWDRQIAEKKREMDLVKDEVDLEKLRATMESLEVFKQQFLTTVKKSVDDYNKSKKELSIAMISREKAFDEFLRRLDSKVAELSELKKELSSGASQKNKI